MHAVNADQQNMLDIGTLIVLCRSRNCCSEHADRQGNSKNSLFQVILLCLEMRVKRLSNRED
jgi:hypothetical protein